MFAVKIGTKFLVLFAICLLAIRIHGKLSENERAQAWFDVGNSWPPHWQPESARFQEAMDFREADIMLIPGREERWANFLQYTQARMVPRFTETGFEVIKTPRYVHDKLGALLDQGLANWDSLDEEPENHAVYSPLPSKFIHLNTFIEEIANDLLSLHEAWSGLKLEPVSTYGVRAYQNGSALLMHYDKIDSHVISSIVHIGHQYDNENVPWPIEIEDHDGNLHAVSLEAGEMLFYESAACLHGRRQFFHGHHYASVFVHYRPVDRSIWNFTPEDIIAKVPPFWNEGIIEEVGSRFANVVCSIDSCVTEGAPPRVIDGVVVEDIREYYNRVLPGHVDKIYSIEPSIVAHTTDDDNYKVLAGGEGGQTIETETAEVSWFNRKEL